jgi:hypothetical protein
MQRIGIDDANAEPDQANTVRRMIVLSQMHHSLWYHGIRFDACSEISSVRKNTTTRN